MVSASTSPKAQPAPLRLGFRTSAVIGSLAVALVFLLGGGWMAGGELWWFEDRDLENALFWLVVFAAGLFLLGVWAANVISRLLAGCSLSAGPDGLRLYTLGSLVAWHDIELLRFWQRDVRQTNPATLLFTLGSAHPKLYLTAILKPDAFHRVTGRLNLIDLIVLQPSMQINRAERKLLFACWPLEGTAQELMSSLAEVAQAHGVRLVVAKGMAGFDLPWEAQG